MSQNPRIHSKMAKAYESDMDYSESDNDYSDEEFDYSDEQYDDYEEFFSNHDDKDVNPTKDPEHFEHEVLPPEAAKEMVVKKS